MPDFFPLSVRIYVPRGEHEHPFSLEFCGNVAAKTENSVLTVSARMRSGVNLDPKVFLLSRKENDVFVFSADDGEVVLVRITGVSHEATSAFWEVLVTDPVTREENWKLVTKKSIVSISLLARTYLKAVKDLTGIKPNDFSSLI